MSKHDPKEVIETLERIAAGDLSGLLTKLYLKEAAQEILDNIRSGKKPNADHALKLSGKDSRATKWRESDIAWKVERLYREYGNQDAAFNEVSKMVHLSEGRVERIYKQYAQSIRGAMDTIDQIKEGAKK
jgi:hypothetical protein